MITALVEGNSIRATARITGADKNTVMSLLVRAGIACKEYQNNTFRNLPCKLIQCDEIWSFLLRQGKEYAKAPPGHSWLW